MTFEEEWEKLKEEDMKRIQPILDEWDKNVDKGILDGGYEYDKRIKELRKQHFYPKLEKLKKKYGR
ncbi:hypothetical protein [Dielma fastidiosa]|uniref:hypothetical protein n=1 Tax=Dielma fastidiosa TaxID=1034346 RepID=UPI000E47AAB0|nr:hypothetical protein [Dielma fastidiosa]RHN01483.1 hypothetical protein DWZ33_05680 [Dielma fastidiosa]